MPKEFPATKTCTKCGVEKPLEEFSPSKTGKYGRHSLCKACKSDYEVERCDQNPQIRETKRKREKERLKAMTPEEHEEKKGQHRVWWDQNKDDINAERRELYETDEEYRERKLKSRKRYYGENREDILLRSAEKIANRTEEEKESRRQYCRGYYSSNREILISNVVKRTKERVATDPNFRLARNLRSRLGVAIKREFKAGSAVRDLGCSIPELRSHLESKFANGMTWENYGKGPGKWNIDHIVPMVAFDLTNRQHVVLACHYLNLQPLWFEDNMSKGDKYEVPFCQ